MSNPYQVSAGEFGVVRVFTTALEPEGDAAITPQNVERLTGSGVSLDPSKVQVFPAKMIEAIGLRAYLAEGYGIPEADMAGTAAALDAQSGLIVLVPSSAFKGAEVTLDPNPMLRLVGTFREERAAPPRRMQDTASAKGVVEDGETRIDPRADRAARRSWMSALSALSGAAALVHLLVF